MTHSALGASVTQVLPAVKESVSKVAGNLNGYDHCGPRVYSITTLPATTYNNVLSLDTATDTLTLGLPTTGLPDINSYSIEITITLQNYATVTKTATFTAHVTHCVITSLGKAPVADQAYNIYTPQIQFAYTEFVQTPACLYTLDYTYQIKDSGGVYSALPVFVAELTKQFTVVSSDPLIVASYHVSITGAVPATYPAFSSELLIKLDMNNGCLADDVTNVTPASIPSFTYLMANDGLLTWSPTWSSSVPGCPLTYEIGRIVSTVEQALTAHETAALTHSSVDGSLQLQSSDYALDTEVWTIKLYKKSTYSVSANGEGVF